MVTTTVTVKGQVTVPKKVRDAMDLQAGSQVEFAINASGEVVLRKASRRAMRVRDGFDTVRGKADVKWRTDELMALLRD